MTPGIEAARRAGIAFDIHSYEHDPAAASYGLEAADKLAVSPGRVFKTLVVEAGRDLAVMVIPVTGSLNMKLAARAAGAKKKAGMAAGDRVERSTGYVLGGVSPLGQRRALPTWVDSSAAGYDTIFVSAGRRGLEIELVPDDLLALTGGRYAELATGV